MGIVMLNNKVLMSGNQMALYIPPFEPPAKGSIVKMNLDGTERQYRVLSVNGNVCKVMGMWDDFTSAYNSTSTTTIFGSTTAQKYADSTLDTYLNTTWYNTLTSATKAAIVPENVVQHCYQYYDEPNIPNTPTYTYQYQYNWSGNNYENANDVGNVVVGNRNVFALDLKDIFDYIGKVCITSDELMTMFWNNTTQVSKYLWLRSSNADGFYTAWYVVGDYGYLNLGNGVDNSYVVRLALNLDMSKIQYTLVQAPPVIETETWVIKDNAPVDEASLTLATTNISFTTNNQKATSIGIEHDGLSVMLAYGGIGAVAEFVLGASPTFEWYGEAYRTLEFDTPPTGNLLTWLQANAIKQ